MPPGMSPCCGRETGRTAKTLIEAWCWSDSVVDHRGYAECWRRVSGPSWPPGERARLLQYCAYYRIRGARRWEAARVRIGKHFRWRTRLGLTCACTRTTGKT